MESAELITAARLRLKLNKKQLAEQVGVAKGTVTRWENGLRKPDQEVVPVLSRVTGIPPEKLRPDLAFMFAASRRRRRAA